MPIHSERGVAYSVEGVVYPVMRREIETLVVGWYT